MDIATCIWLGYSHLLTLNLSLLSGPFASPVVLCHSHLLHDLKRADTSCTRPILSSFRPEHPTGKPSAAAKMFIPNGKLTAQRAVEPPPLNSHYFWGCRGQNIVWPSTRYPDQHLVCLPSEDSGSKFDVRWVGPNTLYGSVPRLPPPPAWCISTQCVRELTVELNLGPFNQKIVSLDVIVASLVGLGVGILTAILTFHGALSNLFLLLCVPASADWASSLSIDDKWTATFFHISPVQLVGLFTSLMVVTCYLLEIISSNSEVCANGKGRMQCMVEHNTISALARASSVVGTMVKALSSTPIRSVYVESGVHFPS